MPWRFHWFIRSSGFKSIRANSWSLRLPQASVSQYTGESDGIYKGLREPGWGWHT